MSLKNYLVENVTELDGCLCTCDLSSALEKINEDGNAFISNLKKFNLKRRFDWWNSKLFGDKLPPVDTLKFLSLRHKGATGICNAKVTFVKGSRNAFEKVWDSKIILDNRKKYTQNSLDAILIHEMIHWYFIGLMKINEDHGMSFKNMASKFTKLVGFEIPLVDNVTTIEDREEELPTVGIVLLERPHKTNVVFTSKNNFDKKVAELLYSTLPKTTIEKDTKVTYGLGKFSKLNFYPLVRNFKTIKLFKISDDDAMNNISWVKDGSVKEIYVNEL